MITLYIYDFKTSSLITTIKTEHTPHKGDKIYIEKDVQKSFIVTGKTILYLNDNITAININVEEIK